LKHPVVEKEGGKDKNENKSGSRPNEGLLASCRVPMADDNSITEKSRY